MNELTILQVKDLKKYFPVGKKLLHAVDGVSFSVSKERLWVLSESRVVAKPLLAGPFWA